jgi:hypothetical protein
VSLQRCAHTRAKLADNTTCGARCGGFPACLPAFPLELAGDVARTLHSPVDEHQAAVAAHEVLDELHDAITEGLTRKVASEYPRPRW